MSTAVTVLDLILLFYLTVLFEIKIICKKYKTHIPINPTIFAQVEILKV